MNFAKEIVPQCWLYKPIGKSVEVILDISDLNETPS